MPNKALPLDTFGDRFDLCQLPLPRPAVGYGIQKLGTDQLLDQHEQEFIEIRKAKSADFSTFDAAFEFASKWLVKTNTPPEAYPMAIVPLGYDKEMGRYILIYGVLALAP